MVAAAVFAAKFALGLRVAGALGAATLLAKPPRMPAASSASVVPAGIVGGAVDALVGLGAGALGAATLLATPYISAASSAGVVPAGIAGGAEGALATGLSWRTGRAKEAFARMIVTRATKP